MLVVVTHQGAAPPTVRVVVQADDGATTTEATTEAKETAPNPILPVRNEIIYAFVGFMALFLILRFLLFPKLKEGMDARAASIRAGHEGADATRAAAQAEATAYDEGIAQARAEAATVLDAARQEVDADRQRKLAEANARIADRKALATREDDAAKAAAMGQVEEAVADVASTIAGRVLGRSIDPASVRGVVSDVVNAGASR